MQNKQSRACMQFTAGMPWTVRSAYVTPYTLYFTFFPGKCLLLAPVKSKRGAPALPFGSLRECILFNQTHRFLKGQNFIVVVNCSMGAESFCEAAE